MLSNRWGDTSQNRCHSEIALFPRVSVLFGIPCLMKFDTFNQPLHFKTLMQEYYCVLFVLEREREKRETEILFISIFVSGCVFLQDKGIMQRCSRTMHDSLRWFSSVVEFLDLSCSEWRTWNLTPGLLLQCDIQWTALWYRKRCSKSLITDILLFPWSSDPIWSCSKCPRET